MRRAQRTMQTHANALLTKLLLQSRILALFYVLNAIQGNLSLKFTLVSPQLGICDLYLKVNIAF